MARNSSRSEPPYGTDRWGQPVFGDGIRTRSYVFVAQPGQDPGGRDLFQVAFIGGCPEARDELVAFGWRYDAVAGEWEPYWQSVGPNSVPTPVVSSAEGAADAGVSLVETPACPDPIECGHEAALGQAQQEVKRVREVCDHLRRVSVLADGEPHTDRERGVIQAVTRVLAALDVQAAVVAAVAGEEPDTEKGAPFSSHVARLVAEDARALRMDLYDDLNTYAQQTGNTGLQQAQIRDHLSEFLLEGLLRRTVAGDRLRCPRCRTDITDYAEDDHVFRTGDEHPYCSGECVVAAHRAAASQPGKEV